MHSTKLLRLPRTPRLVAVLVALLLGLVGIGIVTPIASASPTVALAGAGIPLAAARSFTQAPVPKITGKLIVGKKVRASTGKWAPKARLSYQWYRGKAKIKGARSATYTLVAADRGKRVSVRVTGRAKGRTTIVRASRPSARVAAGRFQASDPSITGTAAVGKTLQGSISAWKPKARIALQWYRSERAIEGATGTTYALTASDVGHKISLRAQGTRKGYATATRSSQPTAVVAAGSFTSTPAPTVTGNLKVAAVLTATTAAWQPAATLSYQWFRGAAAIPGATKATYRLVDADAGSRIRVRVTGVRTGFATTSRDSGFTSEVVGAITGTTPRITGSAVVGSTLRGEPGTWNPAGVALNYQWKLDGVPISGATAATFTLGQEHLRKSISVTVTGRRAGYASLSLTSPALSVGAPSTLGANQALRRGGELWSPTGSYRLVMQGDGNLVLYGPAGAVWASGGSDASRVVMQSDGNLVSYNDGGTARWSTGSWGSGGTRLSVQDDGNLVIYDAGGTARWAKNVVGFITVHTGSKAGSQSGTQSQSAATLSSTMFRVYGVGTRVPVVCGVTNGQAVSGSATPGTSKSTVWHRLLWGDWVPDADFLTGVDGLIPRGRLGFTANEPNCGGNAATSTSLPGVNGWVFPIQPHATLTTYSGHNGDDFPVPNGTPVYAMYGGTVSIPAAYRVDASWCPVPAAVGRTQQDLIVTSVRDGKTYRFDYAHMRSFSVSSGQTVRAGDLLGYSGDRGCVTGPHLHIDIKVNGQANVVYPHNLIGWKY
ncbi:peptidoglycan DD-metalloendopeptidase family protein [Flavimobilis sp. GY10621]|uniref:Peptidoglycan DD-metalloendopeptidase family protein n=1 Tax=Flavimobilis rhizosphaerae TaxID=2775421 RepID=A0ABR9DNL5_9MICO|nr:peptidoglycan DD-metalloendopeptidase family protein [Flavimobilis rhizosphaerae]MBD9698519.1 peptidoglycan DD-metalloendopeptidase family protein [Flavimobilis rhizosphaerae]